MPHDDKFSTNCRHVVYCIYIFASETLTTVNFLNLPAHYTTFIFLDRNRQTNLLRF